MKLRAALSVLLLIAVLAMPPGAPTFPFQRYEQVPASPVGPACEGSVAVFQVAEWTIFSSPDRDIYIHADETGKADFVYFAKGTSTEGVIHIVRVLTVEEARKLYPGGPCSYFTGQEA